MVKIAPSFLSADFRCLEREVKRVEQAGADLIHLDVMDGHFVNNITFGPLVVKTIDRLTDLPLDVHLMIEEPEKYLREFAQSGADYLTVHIEVCDRIETTISEMKSLGVKAGVSLNPDTPLRRIKDILAELDLVLLMTVFPGFAGQRFISSVLEKIKELRSWLLDQNNKLLIEVDGGVDEKTAPLARDAGADVLVAGSALFGAADLPKMMRELRGE
ncbi:MAG: ribulose-phosphate 3-epimerase [bacterium]